MAETDATQLKHPCKEWDGARLPAGYGYHYGGISKSGLVYVHREVWEEAHGPIPDGMMVLHRCDNPPCYLLEHLFLGTQKVNVIDMMRKGRCAKAKLTAEQVYEIRWLAFLGEMTHRQIGEQFGLTRAAVSHLTRGLTWSWLE